MKLTKYLIVTLLIFSAGQASAQYYYYNDRYYDNDLIFEFGAGLGLMNCITDIGGADSDNSFYINEIRRQNFKVSNSLSATVMYRNFLGARLEATWGSVQSADKDIKGQAVNVHSRALRNLSFRSSINEIALLAEFHPVMLLQFQDEPPRFSPYLLAGVGWFTFNPQTLYNGAYINLRPLHTEGQGFPEYKDVKPYKTSQNNIPIGVGIRYELSALFNIRAEWEHRFLFTDYLDDASSKFYVNPAVFTKYLNPVEAHYAQALYNRREDGTIPDRRGNPKSNDTYMTFSLKIGLNINRQPVR